MPPEAPRGPQETPKTPQGAPKRPPGGHKKTPRGPKAAPRGFKTAFQRPPKGVPRDPDTHTRSLEPITQARWRDRPNAIRSSASPPFCQLQAPPAPATCVLREPCQANAARAVGPICSERATDVQRSGGGGGRVYLPPFKYTSSVRSPRKLPLPPSSSRLLLPPPPSSPLRHHRHHRHRRRRRPRPRRRPGPSEGGAGEGPSTARFEEEPMP